MSKLPSVANERTSQQEDPDQDAPIKHCVILTLIGLAGIAISIALPPDENAQAGAASRKGQPTAQLVAPAAATEPTATPFDQVPTPPGDMQELPSTY